MDIRSSFARQAAAADLWMELTGRKEAAAFELALEKMASINTRYVLSNAVLGGLAGGVGGAVGGAAGASKTEKKAGKLSETQQRLLGAGIGAVGAGAGGGIAHYLGAKAGKAGKSRHEIAQEAALRQHEENLLARGIDPSELKGPRKLKHKYKQMLHRHTQAAKDQPVAAGLVGSVPYAVGGGLVGALAGPSVFG